MNPVRVLLAEDDRVYQVMIARLLRSWGYETTVVADGEQAWQHLSSRRGPRLAVLDWVMPHADGLEVCRRVRNSGLPHYVYIIMLTSRTEPHDPFSAFDAGADDYIAKPVNAAELKTRLETGREIIETRDRIAQLREGSA